MKAAEPTWGIAIAIRRRPKSELQRPLKECQLGHMFPIIICNLEAVYKLHFHYVKVKGMVRVRYRGQPPNWSLRLAVAPMLVTASSWSPTQVHPWSQGHMVPTPRVSPFPGGQRNLANKAGGSPLFKKLFDQPVGTWSEYKDFVDSIQEPCAYHRIAHGSSLSFPKVHICRRRYFLCQFVTQNEVRE